VICDYLVLEPAESRNSSVCHMTCCCGVPTPLRIEKNPPWSLIVHQQTHRNVNLHSIYEICVSTLSDQFELPPTKVCEDLKQFKGLAPLAPFADELSHVFSTQHQAIDPSSFYLPRIRIRWADNTTHDLTNAVSSRVFQGFEASQLVYCTDCSLRGSGIIENLLGH